MHTLDTLLTQAKITKADQRSDELYVVSEDQLRALVHTTLTEAISKLSTESVQFADPKLQQYSSFKTYFEHLKSQEKTYPMGS